MRGLSPHIDAQSSGASRAIVLRDDARDALVRLLGDEDLSRGARGRLLGVLARGVAAAGRAAGAGAVLGGRWLADAVIDLAPQIPVRDAAALQARYPGCPADEIADHLVLTASRVTGSVGAAGGAIAAVEYAAPPTLLSVPVQLAAETLVVVLVEVKLVAELHALYGRAPEGSVGRRSAAYLQAWAGRKGIDPRSPGSLRGALGQRTRREIQQRVLRRLGRNVTTLAPMLAGAAIGAELNRRETRRLGAALIRSLRS